MLDLKKNDMVVLNLDKENIEIMSIGLGWDTNSDLDVHAVLRGEDGRVIEKIYYSKLSACGVRLSGDNLTGAGDGDDEIIYVDRNRLDKNVKRISIYVNIFSGVPSFKYIEGGYIRIFNDRTELVKAKLDIPEIKNSTAVHFAELAIEDEIKFKVVMEGGSLTSLIKNYNIDENKIEENKISQDKKKRKKFLGIF